MVGWVPSYPMLTVGLGEENPGNAERGSLEGQAESDTLTRVGRILASFRIVGQSGVFQGILSGSQPQPVDLLCSLEPFLAGASGSACRTARGKLRPPPPSFVPLPLLTRRVRSSQPPAQSSPPSVHVDEACGFSSVPRALAQGSRTVCLVQFHWNNIFTHLSLHPVSVRAASTVCARTRRETGSSIVGAGSLHTQAGVGLAIWRQDSFFFGTCLCPSDLHLIG